MSRIVHTYIFRFQDFLADSGHQGFGRPSANPPEQIQLFIKRQSGLLPSALSLRQATNFLGRESVLGSATGTLMA